jgi:hypothetical protein
LFDVYLMMLSATQIILWDVTSLKYIGAIFRVLEQEKKMWSCLSAQLINQAMKM